MEYGKATKTAVNIGKAVAVGMAIMGIVVLNIWLILIAVFIFLGASQEGRMTEISLVLEGVKVKDIMSTTIPTASTGESLDQIITKMQDGKHYIIPVIDQGRLKGVITTDQIQSIPQAKRSTTIAEDIMEQNIPSISGEEEAMDAFKTMMKKNLNLLVVRKNEDFNGILSRSDILYTLQMKKGLKNNTINNKKVGT
jgi:CBS domain-containing protein